jgi:putative DNA primase/helicase
MADELPPDDNKPPTAEELLQAVLEAQKPKADTQAEIKRLSKFTLIDFEKERKPAAKRLGIRTSVLDKAVKQERPNEEPAGGGRPLELPDPEPWPGDVSGAELLDWIVDAIRRYVVVSETDAFTIALWVVHTHCFELFIISPRLTISSPERRCGKTTLMDVMGPLVARALSTINISGPALFRTVEKIYPKQRGAPDKG